MADPTWHSDEQDGEVRIGPMGWVRVFLRGLVLGTVVFGGLLVLLLVRLVERPLCGVGRPVTPHITQTVCRLAFVILGIKRTVRGTPMQQRGAVVANHVSWLDIFALNSVKRFYFVSKSEVARWPAIGWLARATGTVFIDRDPKRAKLQTRQFQDRLLAGHKLLFFPEGTSTDGAQVLPFKTTLFQAFLVPDLRDKLSIQPVTLIYHAPRGQAAHFYGWWGDMDFGSHMLKTLAASPQGRVELVYHDPVQVRDYANRKDLAADLERRVRAGHQDADRSTPCA